MLGALVTTGGDAGSSHTVPPPPGLIRKLGNPNAPDGLFLDISGVSHLWGGEAELMADFRARLAGNGLPFRLAVADTP